MVATAMKMGTVFSVGNNSAKEIANTPSREVLGTASVVNAIERNAVMEKLIHFGRTDVVSSVTRSCVPMESSCISLKKLKLVTLPSRFVACVTVKLVTSNSTTAKIGVMNWILLGRCVVSNVEVLCVREKMRMESVSQSTTLTKTASVAFASKSDVVIRTMSITELVQPGHAMPVMCRCARTSSVIRRMATAFAENVHKNFVQQESSKTAIRLIAMACVSIASISGVKIMDMFIDLWLMMVRVS